MEMSKLERRFRMTRPQLFAPGRAGAQARRAAGVATDDPHNEQVRPKTRYVSARRAWRQMARLRGAKAFTVRGASKAMSARMRRALGYAKPFVKWHRLSKHVVRDNRVTVSRWMGRFARSIRRSSQRKAGP